MILDLRLQHHANQELLILMEIKGYLDIEGYDIHDLASKSDFLEVCYLLLHGELPSPEDKKNLKM